MTTPATPESATPDPVALLRSRPYLVLLVMGAIVGIPVASAAYGFLKLVAVAQQYVLTTLPQQLFGSPPWWWPMPILALGGLLVAAAITYLPGTGGHSPADGFKGMGAVPSIELPGIALAAFATLAFGFVLGPEAPLIAIGSGIGALALHLIKKDAPEQAVIVIGAAGSFAAVSTLLGSPIVGAFLIMEAAGIGGPLLGVILVPGLLAAGVGSLIFIGLGNWTGFGTFSLAIPDLPPFVAPDGWEFLWAIGIGLIAAVLGTSIRRLALIIRPVTERNPMLFTPVLGLSIGGCAVAFAQITGRSSNEVLFSGQDALGPLIQDAAGWTVAALAVLIVGKSLAYAGSLSSFRGGPTFPGMFVGAAVGMALSHLPGLPMIAGVAMGMGAMTVVMLGLPLTSVMLTVLFLQADGVKLMPLIIVAVVVAYVASANLTPDPTDPTGSTGSTDDAVTAPDAPPEPAS